MGIEIGRTLRSARQCLLLASLLLAGLIHARAQQNVSAATLSGSIIDSTGAALAGASVVLRNVETNQSQTAGSDRNGAFRFNYVPAGNYEVAAKLAGFQAVKRELVVTLGQSLNYDIRLLPAGVEVHVDVTSDGIAIESTRSQLSGTIDPKEVADLPLNGRNYLDLALLLPGVSRTNTGNIQRFAETSAVPGTGLSIAGQRNLNNGFIVDGSSADDDAAELAGTYYSQEVVREFQVVTSGGTAEFGRASAGFVNILTQSGTNDLRGRIYAFLRNRRFDARNPTAASKDPLTQGQYGASLGGTLIEDRTFFFTNFEQTRRHDSNIITIAPANVAAINTWLSQVGYRGPAIETGLVSGGYNATNVFGRIDHRVDDGDQAFVTYNYYQISAVNARTVGGLNAVSRGTDLVNRDDTINAGNITTLSSNALNELRFQYRRSRLAAPVKDDVGPAVNISGVANFGTATSSPLGRDIDLYQISDSLTRNVATHSFKAGLTFLLERADILFPGQTQGAYTFSSLNNFLSGNYGSFQQAFGAVTQSQNSPNIGGFIEDEWRVTRDITFNLGVRYDVQYLPRPMGTDINNWSPRFGFAYSPRDKKTVVRGSFGVYYDRIPLRAVSNALQRDGSKYVVVQLGPTSPGAPAFPNVLAGLPSVLITKPSVTRIEPNIQNSHSQQASLQIERELPFGASFSVGYIYLRGLNLILSRNVNVPTCLVSVDPNMCRPDTALGNISRYEGSGDSYYNGLIATLDKKFGARGNLRVSYTLSKSMDDAGNFFFSSPQDNSDLRGDFGPSDNDQRNRLTVSGSITSPDLAKGGSLFTKAAANWQVGYIFNYASPLPFNVLTGNDRNGDTNFNDRPAGVGRNSARGFDYVSVDLRISRSFKISEHTALAILAEGFNVTNRANYSVPNNTFGVGPTPLMNFGRPTAAFDPRQIQLGVRLTF
jgi:outer membrane receptor protein involved in Fe transport